MGFSIDDRVIAVCTFKSNNKNPQIVPVGSIGTWQWVNQSNQATSIYEMLPKHAAGYVVRFHPDARTKYGFIDSFKNGSVYFKASNVIKGLDDLDIGSLVVFAISRDDSRGAQAVELEVIGKKTGVIVKTEPHGGAEPAPVEGTGHVIKWGGKFGFIARPGKFMDDLFFHKTAWKGEGDPVTGIPVTFTVQKGRTEGSQQAGNVRPDPSGDQLQSRAVGKYVKGGSSDNKQRETVQIGTIGTVADTETDQHGDHVAVHFPGHRKQQWVEEENQESNLREMLPKHVAGFVSRFYPESQKKYGFIDSTKNGSIYFNASSVSKGIDDIDIGSLAIFAIKRDDRRGASAVELEVVGRKTGVVVKVEPQGRAAPAPVEGTGHVTNWRGKFGFIARPDKQLDDIFFHITAWKGEGAPVPGTPVSFTVQKGRTEGSQQAGNVRPDLSGHQLQSRAVGTGAKGGSDYVPPKPKFTKPASQQAKMSEMDELASFFISYQKAKKKSQTGQHYWCLPSP
eukprot:gene10284-39625_t